MITVNESDKCDRTNCSICDIGTTCLYSTCRIVAKKPPLGLMPKDIWMRLRYLDILDTLTRYANEEILPKHEWIEELLELHTKLEEIENGKGTN